MAKVNTIEKTNRLIDEKSPYLLQHAHNPVDWFPWGEEAFMKSESEDKPIFLSIGYSSCHWCHVMERESFEDEQVAEILNKDFISIKVDREERPDIDSIYMSVCQALTGSGGWPLTIIMTPDKKPFFAGTYFPKKSKYGYPGLVDILKKISSKWKQNKNILIESGNSIVNSIKEYSGIPSQEELNKELITEAFETFGKSFDEAYGGFSEAPKFPSPHNISFLFMYWKAYGENKALEMAKTSLDHIYKGGIFDHIGFGFSRYSVDRKWLVPHFEKMLYDNALLAYAYAECYQATGNSLYKQVTEKIFTYVLRDMTSPDGAFYSAEDADSEGEEGRFYLWSKDEIKKVLGTDDGELFCRYYNITAGGNFEHRNIPNLIETDLSSLEFLSIKDKLEKCIEKLFLYREKRIHPFKDDKIITSWNGLMAASLAYGGRVLGEDRYIKAAANTLSFIFSRLQNENGRLLSTFREGAAGNPGFLDDYAFVISALIEMYGASFEIEYLEKAIKLNNDMFDIFWDDNNGGLFLSGRGNEELIFKSKDAYDGAIPSGNSVAAMNNLRLSKITGNTELEERAEDIFRAFGNSVKNVPTAYSKMLSAFLYSTIPGKQIVIAGKKNNTDTIEMLRTLNQKYNPYTTVALNNGSERIYKTIPYAENELMVENKTTAYICENFTCGIPITDKEEFTLRI